jgi:hypothetical protein
MNDNARTVWRYALGVVALPAMWLWLQVFAVMRGSTAQILDLLVTAGAALTAYGLIRRGELSSVPVPDVVTPLAALGAERVLVSGRAAALIPLEVGGKPCVYLQRRLQSVEVEPSDDGAPRVFVDDAAIQEFGAFLIDDGESRALVWPVGGRVLFAESWTDRDEANVSTRMFKDGATVTVVGRPGRHAEMLERMAAHATDQPVELLRALHDRTDLRGLPCFWPNDEGFVAADLEPEALYATLKDRGGTVLACGVFLLALAALIALARTLHVGG